MPHKVVSARLTEEDLRRVTEAKEQRGVGWDGLVLDALRAHYGLEGVGSGPKRPRMTDEERRAARSEASKRRRARKAAEKVAGPEAQVPAKRGRRRPSPPLR